MAQLLINADDFGLHSSLNTAIKNTAEAGVVNSISVCANGLAPEYDLLKELQSRKVYTGAHITWVGERWLTADIVINDWKDLIQRMIYDRHLMRSLEYEAEAQINRLLDNEIGLDHLDSHQHVHHFPGLWGICVRLRHKYNIPRIRVARSLLPRAGVAGAVLQAIASYRSDDKGMIVGGMRYTGCNTIDGLFEELSAASGHDTELIVHPGLDNAKLKEKYSSWHFDWESEYTALMDPAFRACIPEMGFTLRSKG